jgi:DNA-binding LacI/PurR family transcriptional regulator
MHALQASGRTVPNDVAIVGFDDIDSARLASPPLTTIRQDPRCAAEALVDAILEAVAGGANGERVLPVELKVRESSVRRA